VIIDKGNGLEFYGALRVSTAAGVAKLEDYGLHVDGALTFQINTTGDDQIVICPTLRQAARHLSVRRTRQCYAVHD